MVIKINNFYQLTKKYLGSFGPNREVIIITIEISTKALRFFATIEFTPTFFLTFRLFDNIEIFKLR